MASFVYAVWSITQVASVHCAVRPEISPCTCEPIYAHNYVELSCEKVDSFHQIVDALSNKFDPGTNISLKISYSQLEDLEMRSFTDMHLNVVKLRMQWNGLKSVPELPFRGLSNVEFLSVGDNELDEIPKHMLNHMPIVKTLDMGRCRIQSVLQDDFKGIQLVTNLFLPSNNITRLDKGAFPPGLVTLHLGRNQIENLNGTLRDLNKLESLFINMNSIRSLDDELPESNRLKLIIAQNNRLEHLPESMRYMNKLETLHLQYNRLGSLDGIFAKAKNLNQFYAFNNEIQYLAQNEFQSSELLEELDLAFNHIKSLNHSLLPLQRLCIANFSFNEIDEFSMNEIRGLMHLKQLDLSYNLIQKLTGRQENNIDQNSFLIEFNLDHNQLKSLDGALMGLNSLRVLKLSYNQIERILPEDFIGLVKLEILDLSHNQLLTLKEMETTFLPNLKILKVAYNNLTKLEKDFHGLPILCQANLTNNQISSISTELVSETRCMNHNVPGKLELYLDDNPIMCDYRLNELCPIMAEQETRIRGRSQCFENDQEVCTVLAMLFASVKISDSIPILLAKNKKSDDHFPPLISALQQPIIKPLIIASTLTVAHTLPSPSPPSPSPPPPLPPTTTSTSTSTTTTTTTTTSTSTTTTTPTPATITPTTIVTSVHNDEQSPVEVNVQLAPEVPKSSLNIEVHEKHSEDLSKRSDQSNTYASKVDTSLGIPGADASIMQMSSVLFNVNGSERGLTTSSNINRNNNNSNSNSDRDGSSMIDSNNDTDLAKITLNTTSITPTEIVPLDVDVMAPETVPLILNIEEPAMEIGGKQPDAILQPLLSTSGSGTQTEYATVEYIPNIDEIVPLEHAGSSIPPTLPEQPPAAAAVASAAGLPGKSETLDEDSQSNSVHEEFPSPVLTDLINPQSLLIPEEPPENP